MDISIHAPREGSDLNHVLSEIQGAISIHAPREGSDRETTRTTARRRYFYPRSPRGERQDGLFLCRTLRTISIHAPREGSDLSAWKSKGTEDISIHAPREGSDRPFALGCRQSITFLSTLPARGATAGAGRWLLLRRNFYPRSPRGERPLSACLKASGIVYFYPRSPRGERRGHLQKSLFFLVISIHAPREGSDHFPFLRQ